MSAATRLSQMSAVRSGMLLLALVLALLSTTPGHAMTPVPHATALTDDRSIAADKPGAPDEGLRLDRQARAFSATGYQTMLVAGVVGGAAVLGVLAGGVHPAIVAGTAVFVGYLFMPWD